MGLPNIYVLRKDQKVRALRITYPDKIGNLIIKVNKENKGEIKVGKIITDAEALYLEERKGKIFYSLLNGTFLSYQGRRLLATKDLTSCSNFPLY